MREFAVHGFDVNEKSVCIATAVIVGICKLPTCVCWKWVDLYARKCMLQPFNENLLHPTCICIRVCTSMHVYECWCVHMLPFVGLYVTHGHANMRAWKWLYVHICMLICVCTVDYMQFGLLIYIVVCFVWWYWRMAMNHSWTPKCLHVLMIFASLPSFRAQAARKNHWIKSHKVAQICPWNLHQTHFQAFLRADQLYPHFIVPCLPQPRSDHAPISSTLLSLYHSMSASACLWSRSKLIRATRAKHGTYLIIYPLAWCAPIFIIVDALECPCCTSAACREAPRSCWTPAGCGKNPSNQTATRLEETWCVSLYSPSTHPLADFLSSWG